MDIHELESVCAVDTYRNYSEAAYCISSSPAVISKHVAKVERELGVQLFIRASKSRPVEPTPAGKELLGYFHSIINMYHRACGRAAELNTDKLSSLIVGYCPHIGSFHESDILAQFSINNPNITLRRRVLSIAELINALVSGVLDAIFLPLMQGSDTHDSEYAALADSDFTMFEILSNQILKIGLPDSHPLSQCELITQNKFHLLHDETFLFSCVCTSNSTAQREYLRNLLAFQKPMRIRFVDFSEPTVTLKLVESGAGVLPQACIVPRRLGNVNFIPVEGHHISTSLYFVYRKSCDSMGLKLLRQTVHAFSRKYYSDDSLTGWKTTTLI